MNAPLLLRWLARTGGLASTLLLLAFLFGGGEQFRPTTSEAVSLLFFPAGLIAGFVYAWWRDGLGGLISVVSLAFFYIWHYARAGQFPSGPYFLLFAAPAFLHLAAALASHRGSNRNAPPAPSAGNPSPPHR